MVVHGPMLCMALHGITWLEAKPGNLIRKGFQTIMRKHQFQIGGSWIRA